MRITRRTALKGLTAIAAAPLVGCGPQQGSPDAGPPPTLKELAAQRIKTVVVLMMENRSFDHYLGARRLLEGRTQEDGLLDGMSNPDADGNPVAPFPSVETCALDPGHNWNASHAQFNNGANDGFVREHANRYGVENQAGAMAYFDRTMLPATYAMADAHAVCDRWFCSVMSSTWPNRFYSLAATSLGIKRNQAPALEYPTIVERLDTSRRLTWADYAGNLPFAVLLPWQSIQKPEFRKLETFFADAAAGTLPNFCYVEPIYGRNDDHPPSHPLAGQILIASIYKALAESPQWNECLFVVTYDEHGGFYDHVPPPTTQDAYAADGFDRLGFRVPAVVAGPYVKQGHVSSTVYDHTSVLAFMSRMWDLEPLTDRDRHANDLFDLLDEDALRAGAPRAAAAMPVIEADENVIYAPHCVTEGIEGQLRPGASITGQPELEAWVNERYPQGHPLIRTRETDAVYRSFTNWARDRGIWRPT